MKIAIECQDIIVERALQLFLKPYLSRKKDCDFLVCDEKIDFEKPQFIISKHSPQLSFPFSKDELIASLHEFDASLKILAEQIADEKVRILEAKIDIIADEFRKNYQNDIDEAILRLKKTLIAAIRDNK